MKIKFNWQLLPAAVFVVMLGLMTVSVFFGTAQTGASSVSVDFSEQYPFTHSAELTESSKPVFGQYVALADKLTGGADEAAGKYPLFRAQLVNLSSLFERSIGKQFFSDNESSVVLLENGYLTFVSEKADNSQKLTNLCAFIDSLSELGIPCVYAAAPGKSSMSQGQFPAGVYSYTDENNAMLMEELSQHDVNVVDFTSVIAQQQIDYYSLFHVTDHHWKPAAGLWAAQIVSDELAALGFEFDHAQLDPDSYSVELLDGVMFGSQGQKVGNSIASPEALEYITPLFETNYTVEIQNLAMLKTGSYEDVLIDASQFEPDELNTISAYNAYMFGQRGLIQVENNLNQNGKRLLVVKTSFANVMTPFLVNCAQYTDIIDLRYFNGSLESFIEKTSPDTVLMIYGELNGGFSGMDAWEFD